MLQKSFDVARILNLKGKLSSYVICCGDFKLNHKNLTIFRQLTTITTAKLKENVINSLNNNSRNCILPSSSSSSSSSRFNRNFSADNSSKTIIEAKPPSVNNVKIGSNNTKSTASASSTSSPSSIQQQGTVITQNKLVASKEFEKCIDQDQKNIDNNNNHQTESNFQNSQKIELKTKDGKLIVTANLENSKIQNLIFEKGENEKNNEQGSSQTAVSAITSDNKDAKPQQIKRVRLDSNRSSLERNFMTPTRAMSDFLLKASDLESLPKIKRRSPYEQEPPITVYWRKDVEAKAIEVWGSRENLLRECLKREIERKKHQQNIFTVKRRLRDYRREIGSRTKIVEEEPGLFGKSGRVVLIAIGINATNFVFKSFAWLHTGSHSMFAEAIHSLADTINQLILAYGIHKSTQMADSDHPYGYSNMKYVSSLISGVGIFCFGTGLSFYHGITGLMHPEPLQDFFWAFLILGGSLASEGATLLVAVNEIRRSAKASNMSFKEYVIRGQDPCVNVVLTEDAAAVTSVAVAACCMGLSTFSGSAVPDAIGSLLVGGILGGVASFIIYSNVAALVGRSISEEHLNRINSELESDVMIRAIHDVKGIDMGNSLVRYKAEMDFDGRELTRSYLDKQDLNELLKEVKSFQTIDELELFLLKHGENIVDLMGGEIDRIEMKLRKKFPEIRHCDLEIL